MLPDILEVAKKHNLVFDPRTYGNKETLCKCPFCQEDSLPHKKKKFYLSLNIQDKVFKCWFCKESGGVFRFMAVLEGVPESEVISRYRQKRGGRYMLHPSEKLTLSQYRLMGIPKKPNWAAIRQYYPEGYRVLLEQVHLKWKQFVEDERVRWYGYLVVSMENFTYGQFVQGVKEREKEVGFTILEPILKMYSRIQKPEPIDWRETFVLHVTNPKKYPYRSTEKKNERTTDIKVG